MKTKVLSTWVILTVFSGFALEDSLIGFRWNVPAGLKDSTVSVNHRYFYPENDSFGAVLGIIRYDIDTSFAGEPDWVFQSNEAYRIFVETNPYFGYVFGSDTTDHDSLFAMFTESEQFVLFDSFAIYEHTRFTATDGRGYEIYVTTDSADMLLNYALYQSYIDSIKIMRGQLAPLISIEGLPLSAALSKNGLSQNAPNPFSQKTKMSYKRSGQANQPVTVRIFGVDGRLVKTIRKGSQAGGIFSVVWNGHDASGQKVPGGVYLYRLTDGQKTFTRRLTFLN